MAQGEGGKNDEMLKHLDPSFDGWWERKCHYDIDGTTMTGTITIVVDEALRFQKRP